MRKISRASGEVKSLDSLVSPSPCGPWLPASPSGAQAGVRSTGTKGHCGQGYGSPIRSSATWSEKIATSTGTNSGSCRLTGSFLLRGAAPADVVAQVIHDVVSMRSRWRNWQLCVSRYLRVLEYTVASPRIPIRRCTVGEICQSIRGLCEKDGQLPSGLSSGMPAAVTAWPGCTFGIADGGRGI